MENLAKLPPLREIIRRYDFSADKKLGQHFLLDLNITDKIAKHAHVNGYNVIEVGPGPGGLTRSLLYAGAKRVIAVDMDKRCEVALADLVVASEGKLKILITDALRLDEKELIKEEGIAGEIKIVSNLPYNISTELLVKWLDEINLFSSLTLMFQKEVAERIAASPGSKDYGRLSVMTQWLCDVQMLFDLPPSAFVPPPKIHSTVLTITPHKKPLYEANKKTLERLCQAVFGQRRKMLRVSLKQLTPAPEELLSAASIEGTRRPEQLSISEFCALARALDDLAARG